MIQKLKEIKRQSLDLYKEQSPNLYAIPQISKQDIERVEGLGINFKIQFVILYQICAWTE